MDQKIFTIDNLRTVVINKLVYGWHHGSYKRITFPKINSDQTVKVEALVQTYMATHVKASDLLEHEAEDYADFLIEKSCAPDALWTVLEYREGNGGVYWYVHYLNKLVADEQGNFARIKNLPNRSGFKLTAYKSSGEPVYYYCADKTAYTLMEIWNAMNYNNYKLALQQLVEKRCAFLADNWKFKYTDKIYSQVMENIEYPSS